MSPSEIVVWVVECMPWAALISIVITISASILLDFSLESDGWLGLLAILLPAFLVGMLLMLAITGAFGALLQTLLRALGMGRH